MLTLHIRTALQNSLILQTHKNCIAKFVHFANTDLDNNQRPYIFAILLLGSTCICCWIFQIIRIFWRRCFILIFSSPSFHVTSCVINFSYPRRHIFACNALEAKRRQIILSQRMPWKLPISPQFSEVWTRGKQIRLRPTSSKVVFLLPKRFWPTKSNYSVLFMFLETLLLLHTRVGTLVPQYSNHFTFRMTAQRISMLLYQQIVKVHQDVV